jgi:hypothetical protein
MNSSPSIRIATIVRGFCCCEDRAFVVGSISMPCSHEVSFNRYQQNNIRAEIQSPLPVLTSIELCKILWHSEARNAHVAGAKVISRRHYNKQDSIERAGFCMLVYALYPAPFECRTFKRASRCDEIQFCSSHSPTTGCCDVVCM